MTPIQAADLVARHAAAQDAAQQRFDAGPLGRRGTTNRLLVEWINDQAFFIPDLPAGSVTVPLPLPAGTPGDAA